MPSPLLLPGGRRVETAAEWTAVARPLVLGFFGREVYGPLPPRPARTEFVLEEEGRAFGGRAIRRQVRVVSGDAAGSHSFEVLVYLPADAAGPVPAFVCPNFFGNPSVADDPAVRMPDCPLLRGTDPADVPRGSRAERLPVRDLLAAGFAVATFCHGAVYPDYSATPGREALDGAAGSVWRIFPPSRRPAPPLALSTWAWGDARALDLLETMPEIDARRVAVAGHSRLASAAVVAAAFDARFALCCASGGGGKSLALVPNLKFPAWFAPGLRRWTALADSALPPDEAARRRGGLPLPPFDQAALLGCIAPRALHLCTSDGDVYAPPEVQFDAVRAVSSVYRLFGATALPGPSAAGAEEPFLGDVSWHCKRGPHSITREDWAAFLAGAKRRFSDPSVP